MQCARSMTMQSGLRLRSLTLPWVLFAAFAVVSWASFAYDSHSTVAAKTAPMPRLPGATVDPLTGQPVGRFTGSQSGPPMIEPLGGRTVAAGRGGFDTHTLYPNGANYQRLNPVGHPNNPTPYAHDHAPGTGPGMRGQGPSLDTSGNIVPWNSSEAHWPFP